MIKYSRSEWITNSTASCAYYNSTWVIQESVSVYSVQNQDFQDSTITPGWCSAKNRITELPLPLYKPKMKNRINQLKILSPYYHFCFVG